LDLSKLSVTVGIPFRFCARIEGQGHLFILKVLLVQWNIQTFCTVAGQWSFIPQTARVSQKFVEHTWRNTGGEHKPSGWRRRSQLPVNNG